MATPKLVVEDLHVRFRRSGLEVVGGVSFTVGREKLGIVGESGSGKSLTARAILKLQPASAAVTARTMRFGDIDLLAATEKEMQRIRGRHIAMIMQDPKYSLNPVMSVGEQVSEAYRTHHRSSAKEARNRSLEMLERVRIREPKRVYNLRPHEVSGGMGQRIMFSMMLIPGPSLIIADEPTSALDVSVRQRVLAILDELIEAEGISLIFISHDLNLVRSFCDRVTVMYAGHQLETLQAADLESATHPYTQGLLAALPRLDRPRERLQVLRRDPAWLEGPAK